MPVLGVEAANQVTMDSLPRLTNGGDIMAAPARFGGVRVTIGTGMYTIPDDDSKV